MKNYYKRRVTIVITFLTAMLLILAAICILLNFNGRIVFAEQKITVNKLGSKTERDTSLSITSKMATDDYDEMIYFESPSLVDADGSTRAVYDSDLKTLYVSKMNSENNRINYIKKLSDIQGNITDILISEENNAIMICILNNNLSTVRAYPLDNLSGTDFCELRFVENILHNSIANIGNTIYFYGRGNIYKSTFNKTNFQFDSPELISNLNNTGTETTIGNIVAINHNSNTKLLYVSNGNVYESYNGTLSANPVQGLSDIKWIDVSKNYLIAQKNNEAVEIYNYSVISGKINISSPTAPSTCSLTISEENDNEKNLKSINFSAIDYNSDLIFISDSEYNSVKIYNPVNLNYLGMLGTYGTANFRFNNPLDCASSENYLFVADSGNNRILRFSQNSYSAIEKTELINQPLLVAANKYDQFYVYDTTKNIAKYGYDMQKISGTEISLANYNITQITVGADNALYLYDSISRSILKIKDNHTTVETFCTLPNPITKISFALSGRTLYAASKDTVYPIDNNGKIIEQRILDISNYEFSKLVGIAVDYEGNIFVTGEEKNSSSIYMYKIARNGATEYETEKGFSFNSELFSFNGINDISFDLKNNNCYIVSGSAHDSSIKSGNTVIILNSLFSTSNKTYNDAPKNFDFVKIGKLNADSEFMAHLTNFEDVFTINSKSYVVLLAQKEYGNKNYYYVHFTDNEAGIFLGFIQSDKITIIDGKAVNDAYKTLIPLTADTITIYKTPIETEKIGDFDNILAKNITNSIDVVNDVCNDNGNHIVIGGAKWFKVSYNGTDGYITKYRVLPFVQDDAMPINKFAKIKADAIGITVPLYAQPDKYSAVLNFLIDGKKVSLCEPYDKNSEFTKVSVDGKIGFVLTKSLILEGLTTGQIVAIIVSSVIGTIAIIILIWSIMLKKKRKESF